MVPAGEALKAVQELAATLAAKAPVALRYAKEAVTKGPSFRWRTASGWRTT
jgi:enoyl-CoA hydratase/carnithine racemase